MARGSPEAGSGSLLALSIAAVLAAVLVSCVPLSYGLTVRAGVAGAADVSALAAADVAAGILSGEPCAVAQRVAASNGCVLAHCGVDGSVVSVSTSRTFLGVPLVASATAGPPGAVSK
jgi:secretion/DNA translocation related TadE-like protein